jgi:hypothetical protein
MFATKSYTSSRERLLKLGELGPFFEGRHAMQVFGWSSKTAAQYMWLWARQGLVKPLGGKSDIFFNLVADTNAEAHLEEAIRTVMPGAVVGAHNVLHAMGLTTQRPGRLHLLVRPDERRVSIEDADIEARPATWWAVMDIAQALEPGTEATLSRLRAGAALADAATTAAVAPDDIDFAEVKPADRRHAVGLLALLNAPMQPGRARSFEAAYRQAYDAALARGARPLRIRAPASVVVSRVEPAVPPRVASGARRKAGR